MFLFPLQLNKLDGTGKTVIKNVICDLKMM